LLNHRPRPGKPAHCGAARGGERARQAGGRAAQVGLKAVRRLTMPPGLPSVAQRCAEACIGCPELADCRQTSLPRRFGRTVILHRRGLLAAALGGAVPPVQAAKPPVVLELFTSQGCSSCPPADALLGMLAQRKEVIALAWHVDYWDHLGWRDPYASRTATERQRAYAARLAGEVFTPALVMNGSRLLIGSQRAAIEAAIAEAPALPVAMTLRRTEAGLTATVAAAPAPVRVLRVGYDPELLTSVAAGENHGARLREYRVVREVEPLGDWDGAPRTLPIEPAKAGRGQVILAQAADLRILGALDLPPG
jgi:hypothetical protein